MPPRKVPIRSCTMCGLKAHKRELVRLVRTPEGSVEVDPTGKKAGRGAYLCSNQACWQATAKGNRLSQALRGPVSSQDKERISAYWLQLSQRRADKEES